MSLLKAQWGRLKPSRSAAAHYPGGCGGWATDADRGWTGPHSWQMALGAFGQPGGQGTEVQEKPWGGSRRDKFGKRWRRGSLEQQQDAHRASCSHGQTSGLPQPVPPRGGFAWAVPGTEQKRCCLPVPALGLHGRLAAVVWASQPVPASFQAGLVFFFSFSPLRKRQSRKLALCSRQGGFEQDNPFGQASNTSV